ncbi:ABC transporter substrate-binding protein [Paracoccaceae bacterium Fryx2]|nr:ABC transporter substrate-binding protein [Paracoccaceae bacterium Fryx2]MDT8858369.1 ABC transporter substrate-binding protein [Paracoccaceae bacterium Fryx2]
MPVAVSITVTNSPIFVRIAEILQAQVAEAGFEVTINQIDATSLITVLRGREFDLCMSPWSGRSDPDGNMFNYFTQDGPNNFAGWQSAEADQMLNEARASGDPATRAELYGKIQRLIVDEAPMLFLAHPATLQASTANLDWVQYPDGALRLQFASFT